MGGVLLPARDLDAVAQVEVHLQYHRMAPKYHNYSVQR